jgi:CHAD domain-containing protein
MAKAKQVKCPDPPPDPQKWLADLLLLRFDEVLNKRGAALDPANIDGVHDMRVATRRLRGALRDFDEMIDCPKIKRVRKGLRELADELGEVRDHDVAIIALEKLMDDAESQPVREGITAMIDERRAMREEEYLDLLKVISVTSIEDLQQKFASAVEAALGQRGLFQPSSLSDAGREIIAARIEELIGLSANIYEPFNDKALHRLRIAAKRLRYAIELFGTCWNGAVDDFAEDVARLQSALGEVHDADVWIASLSKRLKKKGRSKSDNGAQSASAAWLLSEFVKKRSREYREALDVWRKWQVNDFTANLRQVIDA